MVQHADELRPYLEPGPVDVVEANDLHAGLIRLLDRDGWMRVGWPEEVGGTGGDIVQRATIYDLLGRGGVAIPERLYPLEILGPTLLSFAPDMAKEMLPAYLAGDEFWCQGFSEPEAGSDLASLRCRAEEVSDGFIVRGQKIWTSNAQLSTRCMLLARTGEPDSRHQGLTMFMVDLDSPGVEIRTIRAATGEDQLCEVFFDHVHVPSDRVIGEVNGGWAVTMYLLQFERSMYAWMRQAVLHERVHHILEQLPADRVAPFDRIGELYLAVSSLRTRSLRTVERLASGDFLGPEVSVDKLLLSTAEQLACDVAREALFPLLETGEGEWADYWRSSWYFSRAASILGGTSEIQKGIVAQRLLGMPREEPRGR
nr:acyl-CoA dehydrogenase family protein [Aeromicrobium wangtongii]